MDLKNRLREIIPAEQERIKSLRRNYGTVSLGETTVETIIGGMRGINGIIWEPSLLDAEEGIRFRGHSIRECQKLLPKAPGGIEPLPEGLLWLLLTSEIPTAEQVEHLSHDLRERSHVPDHVFQILQSLPDAHPMTQFTVGVMALQNSSLFAKAYKEGLHKTKYWEVVFEDALNLIAKIPQIAAFIYRRCYKDGEIPIPNENLDYAANFSHMLGYDSDHMYELMRLYITLHADHEGGNVSAHTVHLVGSALSDPYLSFAAGLNGLAGPLHGLANQEVLHWLEEIEKEIGVDAPKDQLKKFVEKTLKSGKVIPGFGHAILRGTDPRYLCQREFALKHMPDDPMFGLVSNLFEVVPQVLLATGKVRNPWPNVDAHSGILLKHYGLSEASYFTVLFGVSRAIGTLSQLIWDRALGFPIERPKSITIDWLEQHVKAKIENLHG